MYLGDVEVFRTSTAEPTENGIVWTYVKEMDQYYALWQAEQKIIFDLGNLIDENFTGAFNTTLTATFFSSAVVRTPADIILPISARLSSDNLPSAFAVPGQNASISHQLPQNVKRAVVSLSATGQSEEEFWYSNVLPSDENTFFNNTGTLYGYSPFREVQLLIDGELAGLSWPYPIIFTGGIAPGLWGPIVGIDAFDLREQEIDVSPFLPLLCDGANHTFEIRVVGIERDEDGDAALSQLVGSYWVVTGKIFLFLDEEDSITSGTPPEINTSPPDIAVGSFISQNSTGANETLTYTTTVSRTFSVTSTVITTSGSENVTWTQELSYNSFNEITAQGFTQLTEQITTGTDSATTGYISKYGYPLTVNSTYEILDPTNSTFSIAATLSRGLRLAISGPAVFPSGIKSFIGDSGIACTSELSSNDTLLETLQTGSALYISSPVSSSGTTGQDYTFSGVPFNSPLGDTVELYRRYVLAVNGSLVQDKEALCGRMITTDPSVKMIAQGSSVGREEAAGVFSVRSLLGRGPGSLRKV